MQEKSSVQNLGKPKAKLYLRDIFILKRDPMDHFQMRRQRLFGFKLLSEGFNFAKTFSFT